jgi:hypothetical protein
LPPVRVRPPQEKFLDWGQRIDASDLEQVNAEFGIYKRKAVDQRPAGPDYIKIDDHYYPILPSGEYTSPDLAFIFDHRIDINHFAQFEHLISTDMFSQPRPVYFAPIDKRWVNSLNLSFNKTLTSYVGDAFPTFSPVSRQQVAQTLFGQANPTGVTASGLAIVFRTLKSWRGRSVESGSLGDPLSMLPVTPKNAVGQWLMESYSGPFNRLRLSTDGVDTLLHGVMRSGTEESLRALLSERLVSSGYEMIPGYRLGSELLFKRPGRAQLFWLSLRRVLGDLVDGSQYIAPRPALMDDAARTLVTQAQAANQFVALVGGVRIPVAGAAVEIFVIRV